VTSISGNQIVISWTAPNNNGAAITSYKISIRHHDEVTFSEDLTNCDGSSSEIVLALQCSIPLTTLTSAPYSLVFGDSIFAKVIAVNYYGDSIESESGNGAIITSVPTPTINLVDNTEVTSAYIIGLTWDEGF
jgi:hypothetical protein